MSETLLFETQKIVTLFEVPTEQVVLLSYQHGLRKLGSKHFVPKPSRPKTDNVNQMFRVERARWSKLEDSFRRYSQLLWRQVERNELTTADFAKTYSDELYKFQAKALVLGRQSAGDYRRGLDDAERSFLHGQHAGDMKFLQAFMRDVQNSHGRMPYRHRLDMYALTGHTSYLRGVVATAKAGTRWLWDMNALSEHCTDCARLHHYSRQQGGITTNELLNRFGLPGQKVKCLTKCQCTVTEVGSTRFYPRTRPTSYRHVSRLVQNS